MGLLYGLERVKQPPGCELCDSVRILAPTLRIQDQMISCSHYTQAWQAMLVTVMKDCGYDETYSLVISI